jgi:GH24 family phage-related lysozyme (muramidase)
MRTSSQGLSLITRFEGFSPKPYRCPAGWWTIGYGHVITAHERESLREVDADRALALLQADVGQAEAAITRLIEVPLAQSQFDALVSFTFNLGAGALQRSTLRRVINREAHEQVPHELMKWVWASGRKLPGLIRRRVAEGELYQR